MKRLNKFKIGNKSEKLFESICIDLIIIKIEIQDFKWLNCDYRIKKELERYVIDLIIMKIKGERREIGVIKYDFG
jgi:hypothetical protein